MVAGASTAAEGSATNVLVGGAGGRTNRNARDAGVRKPMVVWDHSRRRRIAVCGQLNHPSHVTPTANRRGHISSPAARALAR
jgi:hypothetical protein